jgi:glycosyltransferase involved in cell wall biosynthesis
VPIVTVAVPVHNGGETLLKCLESLAAQTCSSFRVVVFENASTDKSRVIAERFAKRDHRFEVRPSSSFLTAEQNFSRAVTESAQDSEFFCLRAADDYSSRNYLEELYNALSSHPEASLAVSPVAYLQPDGREHNPTRHSAIEFQSHTNDRYQGFVFPGSWYYGLYRSEKAASYLLNSFRLFPYPWGMDRLVVYKMIADLGIVIVPSATFYCQINTESNIKYVPKGLREALRRRWKYYSACMDMDLHKNSTGPIDAIHSRLHAWKIAGRHTGTRSKQLFRLALGLKKKIART